MAGVEIKDRINRELDRMSDNGRQSVLDFARSMNEMQGDSGKSLLRFAGILDGNSAQEMRQAIEEGCERVDPDEW